jgi:hypothetical protein
MGSVGDRDNALAETFFASLGKELLRRERFKTGELQLQSLKSGSVSTVL